MEHRPSALDKMLEFQAMLLARIATFTLNIRQTVCYDCGRKLWNGHAAVATAASK
jgi:hypothetical protein